MTHITARFGCVPRSAPKPDTLRTWGEDDLARAWKRKAKLERQRAAERDGFVPTRRKSDDPRRAHTIERVMDALCRDEWRTVEQIMQAAGLSESCVGQRLADCLAAGRVQRRKQSMGGKRWRYEYRATDRDNQP